MLFKKAENLVTVLFHGKEKLQATYQNRIGPIPEGFFKS